MSDYPAKSKVISILRERGFSAELIPEAETKTPDVRCADGELEYLIEIKEKSLDGERAADLVTTSGYARREPLSRANEISGVIQTATKQLETVAERDAIRLMWFYPKPPHDELLYQKLRYRVYGISLVYIRLPDGSSEGRECYYADHSDFFTQRAKLDGVVINDLRILLLNDHSPRYDRLRLSKLSALVEDGIEDPPQAEEDGKAFYLRSEVNRADVEEVKRSLGMQCGGEVVDMPKLVNYSAVIR